jgi:hypothetical protein
MHPPNLNHLRLLALREFTDIIQTTGIVSDKLRIVLKDSSYIDFWWSKNLPGRFAHHWERRHVDGKIYRHDNAPHNRWISISTFPRHFHCERDSNVIESGLNVGPEVAVREFLSFARILILKGNDCT